MLAAAQPVHLLDTAGKCVLPWRDGRAAPVAHAVAGIRTAASAGQARLIATGTVFSRFMIAPLEYEAPSWRFGAAKAARSALSEASSCAVIGAHDYPLGRHNCQQFLRAQFIHPQGNPSRLGLIQRGAHWPPLEPIRQTPQLSRRTNVGSRRFLCAEWQPSKFRDRRARPCLTRIWTLWSI
jgi:hypothetical protein